MSQDNDPVPTFDTTEDLATYIEDLVTGIQWGEPLLEDPDSSFSLGYEQSADALWKAALAAFNLVARRAGVTGFQAGWATMMFFREANLIKGPFGFVKAEDALYPQYNLPEKVRTWLEEDWADWIREEAQKHLEDDRDLPVNEAVLAHWHKLAEGRENSP